MVSHGLAARGAPNGHAQRPASEHREPAGPLQRDVRQPAHPWPEGRPIVPPSTRRPPREPLQACRRRSRWGRYTVRTVRGCRCRRPCSRSSGLRSIGAGRDGAERRASARGTARVSPGGPEAVDGMEVRARHRRRCSKALHGSGCPVARTCLHSAFPHTLGCGALSLAARHSGPSSLRHEESESRPYVACGTLSRVVYRTPTLSSRRSRPAQACCWTRQPDTVEWAHEAVDRPLPGPGRPAAS